jgi:hypothetical protein
MVGTVMSRFRLGGTAHLWSRGGSGTFMRRGDVTFNTHKWFGLLSATAAFFVLTAVSGSATLAASPTPTATSTPTYSGLLLYNVVTSPVTVPAGATVNSLATVSGTDPLALAYGVHTVATVFVRAAANDTTCLIKLAGGAVFGTPITVRANTTVSITFCDTSPGFPGQQRYVGISIQAGAGGPLTVLPPTSLRIEAVASEPGNNAY